MRVTTIVAHESADHEIHQPGDVYELSGLALELRTKDGIVRAADAPPAPEPSVADVIAQARGAAPDPAE
jgi:hypothetical protein